MTRPIITFLAALAIFATAMPTLASADAGFRKWKRDFSAYASRKGISKSTFRRAYKGINSPDPEVLELARYQPEFRQKLWMYFDSRVNETSVARGQEEKKKLARWLRLIEQKYGVSSNIVLAIWSMESTYGAAMEKPSALRNIIRSLSTLAYADKRRRKFARGQLIGALKILQSGADHSGPAARVVGGSDGAIPSSSPPAIWPMARDLDRNGKTRHLDVRTRRFGHCCQPAQTQWVAHGGNLGL